MGISSRVSRISSAKERPDTRDRAPGAVFQSGFTLIEITLVVLIISIMLTLVLPRFLDSGKAEVRKQAQKLQSAFRLVRSEAVLKQTTYDLHYDLDNESYWVTSEEGIDTQFAKDFGLLGRGVRLSGNTILDRVAVDIADVGVLSEVFAQGSTFTRFYPEGTVDQTIIHLTSGKAACTLYLDARNRLVYKDGYQNVSYGR